MIVAFALLGFEIALQASVEILMDAGVQDFDHVGLGEELISKQVLMGTDLELHHPHAFEGADLGLSEERVVQQRTDLIVYSGLNGFREPPL